MAFTEIDEKQLVQAYQAGDERAFDTIVRTQYNALYAHAVRRLSQHEAAEDAVQDTLLRAYRALPNLDGDLALKAWLHRILTNVCHDEGNRRRRQVGLLEKQMAQPEEVVGDIAEEAILFETVQTMAKALEDIPERYREALVLRYVDGLSFREVGEATGVSEENARARVHRGRQALHKLLARVAVLAAFVIPGLRKTQQAATVTTEQAASTATTTGAEPVHLVTQLTSHAVNAAPAVGRLAEFSAALPGGKSTLAAAAVTAVAAVSVPVAYTVNEVRQPERPPAAVAAPLPDTSSPEAAPSSAPTTGAPVASAGVADPTTTSTTAPATTTTLPRSLTEPFAGAPEGTPTSKPTTPTTEPPPTTVPPDDASARVLGRLEATAVEVTGELPQLDLTGAVQIDGTEADGAGTIGGRLFVYDDGTARADELVLDLGDTRGVLRFQGKVTERSDEGDTAVFAVAGIYHFDGAADFGLAERGDADLVLRLTGESASLSFELSGTPDA